MKALSMPQPYASLIINGLIDVFNSEKPTIYVNQRIAIYANETFHDYPMAWALLNEFHQKIGVRVSGQLPKNTILGTAEIVACEKYEFKPIGRYHRPGLWGYKIKNPDILARPISTIAESARHGFFDTKGIDFLLMPNAPEPEQAEIF